MKSILLFLFSWVFLLTSLAASAPDTTRPADIENMKKIGAALNTYKKAKGEFPDHLSDLVPKFLEAKTLVSPLGVEADSPTAKGGNDPKLPCSYEYRFSTDRYSIDPFNKGSKRITKRAANRIELEEYGSTTPILRCFLYERALNLSHGGDIYDSFEEWTESDESRLLMKKNGYGPGWRAGKKLVVHLRDEAGHPVAGAALSVSGRECSKIALAERDFTSDTKGEVTIPLGTDDTPGVTFKCLQSPWFLALRTCTFGDSDTPAKGETAMITVVLQPAAAIGGVVRDAHGHPLLRAAVLIGKPSGEDLDVDPDAIDESSGVLTDAQGAWELPSFPRNHADLKIYFVSPGSRIVEGAPGEHGVPDAASLYAKTADLQLPPPFLVKGVVVSQGKPLAGATVFFQGAAGVDRQEQMATDAEGRFAFPAVGECTAAFVVLAEHLAPFYQKVRIAINGPAYQLALESGRPAKARLVNAHHQVLANATLLFEGFTDYAGAPLPTQPVIGITDDNGQFTWEHAPEVPVRLRVLLPSGETKSAIWKLGKPGAAELRLDE
jgi:hypothetical protein